MVFLTLMRWMILLILLAGCSHNDQKAQDTGPVKERPVAEYRDTTVLDMHDGSRLSWILKTTHLVKWPKSDLIRAEPADLEVFDSLGAPLMWVTADSGSMDEPANFLMAKGNVHGHSCKGMDLRTDSLRWNRTGNQVSTDAPVRVVSEDGDVLTGKGFVSDANLNNWQILSDVHGVFQKVNERAETLDSTPVKHDSVPAAVVPSGKRKP
jgi:LPS export ABC transporter protein LptC